MTWVINMPKAKSGRCCSGRLWFFLRISAIYTTESGYFAVIVPIGAWFKSKHREYIMLGHAVGFSICGLIKAEL